MNYLIIIIISAHASLENKNKMADEAYQQDFYPTNYTLDAETLQSTSHYQQHQQSPYYQQQPATQQQQQYPQYSNQYYPQSTSGVPSGVPSQTHSMYQQGGYTVPGILTE